MRADVVWLNGAFGVGKTSVARALRARVRGAVVVDPERIGWVLARVTARGRCAGDFQELEAWLTWTVRAVRAAARVSTLAIVPMTVDDDARRAAILGALTQGGADVLHVTLRARPETLATRLAARGHAASAWIAGRNRACVPAFAALEPHVDTDGRPIEDVAAAVLDLRAGTARIAR
jgi:chloramphenicol 3-O-phosphotransferase